MGAAYAHKDLQLQAQAFLWLVQCFPTTHVQRFPQHACTTSLVIQACSSDPHMLFIISNLLTFARPHAFTHTMCIDTCPVLQFHYQMYIISQEASARESGT